MWDDTTWFNGCFSILNEGELNKIIRCLWITMILRQRLDFLRPQPAQSDPTPDSALGQGFLPSPLGSRPGQAGVEVSRVYTIGIFWLITDYQSVSLSFSIIIIIIIFYLSSLTNHRSDHVREHYAGLKEREISVLEFLLVLCVCVCVCILVTF